MPIYAKKENQKYKRRTTPIMVCLHEKRFSDNERMCIMLFYLRSN